VNAICTGTVRTQTSDRRLAHEAERLSCSIEALDAAATPLGRRLEPEEIGPLAVFLASREADAINGQAVNIDGGLTAGRF
jgi:NAD(P)-dependent dehydrogenase (short-subunit alcohol dehydrogenase family)